MRHITTVCPAPRFQRVRGGKERPAGAGAMDADDDGPPDDANEMSRVSCILQVCAPRGDTLAPQGVVLLALESPPLILQAWAVRSTLNPTPWSPHAGAVHGAAAGRGLGRGHRERGGLGAMRRVLKTLNPKPWSWHAGAVHGAAAGRRLGRGHRERGGLGGGR